MKTTFSSHDYHQLSAFARAYLHEDFKLEHGTPEGALDDFRKHATPAQVAALTTELETFLNSAATVPFAQVQTWWTRDLGSAWLPSDKNQLLALQQRLKPDDTH